MYKYRVPATSANLGVGFDTLGLALNIYNYFTIEESATFSYQGFMEIQLKENLFHLAYKKTCLYHKTKVKPISVNLKSDIPIARGLGSSSALIVGGIYAYYLINELAIDKKEILKIATKIEGHPDNVAPCIYGGLCAVNNDKMINTKISNKWHLSILVPNYEVKTSEARKVIKQEIALKDAVNNISSALIGIKALQGFDLENVTVLNNDKIHEPYRKALIKDYNKARKLALSKGAQVFLISGSGSTMLTISDKKIDIDIKNVKQLQVKVDYKGVTCLKNYSL